MAFRCYREYWKLGRSQRKSARGIAKSGVLSGQAELDRAAYAWLTEAFIASIATTAIFLGFALGDLASHHFSVAYGLACAVVASGLVAISRGRRFRYFKGQLAAH